MKYGVVRIPYEYGYLLVISDSHIGDKAFEGEGREKLQENIEWVRKEPHARVFLNGDIVNVATRTSKTSPFEQTMALREQIEFAVKVFTPIKDKIVGAIDGNHCMRIRDICGYSPMVPICHELKVPYYEYSAVMNYVVGKNRVKVSYTAYHHHTTGGGGTVGGKMNRVDALRKIVCNADLYIGSHNHQLGVVPITTREIDTSHFKVNVLRQLLVDSGGYLGWDESYPEAKMMSPSKIGSPRIRFDGNRKDIHCSV